MSDKTSMMQKLVGKYIKAVIFTCIRDGPYVGICYCKSYNNGKFTVQSQGGNVYTINFDAIESIMENPSASSKFSVGDKISIKKYGDSYYDWYMVNAKITAIHQWYDAFTYDLLCDDSEKSVFNKMPESCIYTYIKSKDELDLERFNHLMANPKKN